jgi:hypothetical protein
VVGESPGRHTREEERHETLRDESGGGGWLMGAQDPQPRGGRPLGEGVCLALGRVLGAPTGLATYLLS